MFNQFKGSFYILTAAFIFGLYGVFSRYLEDYGVLYQTYVRCAIITAILLIIGYFKKDFRKVEKQDIKWFALISFFTIFSTAPIVYAYRHMELSSVSFLFYASYTIFTYLMGIILFKEKMTKMKALCLVLAFIGLGLIFSLKFSAGIIIPVSMTILTGIASSGEGVVSKKVSDRYSNNQVSITMFAAIAVTHVIISLAIGEKQDPKLFTDSLGYLLGFAAIAIVGVFALVAGFKYLDPSIAAIIGLTEIIFTVVLGMILFDEKLTANTMIGGALILLAGLLPNVKEYWEKRHTSINV